MAALLAGVADWEHEATLGCDVAVRLPGFDPRDDDLLRPRALYRRQDRADEYAALAHRLTLRWAWWCSSAGLQRVLADRLRDQALGVRPQLIDPAQQLMEGRTLAQQVMGARGLLTARDQPGESVVLLEGSGLPLP